MDKIDKELQELDRQLLEMHKLQCYDGEDRVVTFDERRSEITDEEKNSICNTSFYEIDNATGGFRAGEVVVVSGATKHGKTLLLQTWTQHYSKQNIHTLWFPFEGNVYDFLFTLQGVSTSAYMPRRLYQNDIRWFEMRIKEAVIKYDIKAVFIDHIHFLVDLAQGGNTSWNIGNVMRNIVRIANELSLVVFVVAHIQKWSPFNVAGNPQYPHMGLIRDSSFITQDAAFVFIIWRCLEAGSEVDDIKYSNESVLSLQANRRTGENVSVHLIKHNNILGLKANV